MKNVLFPIVILISNILLSMDYIDSPIVSEEYYGITVNDDIFYGVTTWGLMIYNVEDKYNPVLLDKIMLDYRWGAIYSSTIDNLLIVGRDITYIFDINLPESPQLITELPISIYDCKISGQNLFVINGDSWETLYLEIYNIEDIEHPVLLSEIEEVSSFDIFGNILYTIAHADQDSIATLKAYNIQEIENPVLINELNLVGNHDWPWPYMIIENEILYVDTINRFNVLSLENPNEPLLLGDVIYDEPVYTGVEFDKNGSYIYSKTNHIFDVSNPYFPEISGNYAPDWPPYSEILDISFRDDYLYVANNIYGFYLMDIFNPLNPEMITWHENFDYFHGIFIYDELAFSVSWYGGLTILDVSNPLDSFVIGEYQGAYYNDIVVNDNLAYVGADSGLLVFDVSDPENPVLLDVNNGGGGIDRLLLKDNLIFALESTFGGFSIYNIENSNNTQCISNCDLMEYPLDLCIKDNYLFVADGNLHSNFYNYYGGLRVFDISDPSIPELSATVNPDTSRFYRSIEIKDNYVFMGSNESGIYVFDVTNPSAPIASSYITVEEDIGIMDMEINDNYLYTTSLRGKFIFDIENINLIECLDFYPGGEYHCCWSLYVDGNYIYEAGSVASNIFFTEYSEVGITIDEQNIPYDENPFTSCSNFPNPFNPTTTISFETTNLHEDARIDIYNIKGQHIREFNIYNLQYKNNSVVWDGTDEAGNSVSSGIYFYRLISGSHSRIKKAILMK